MSDMGGSRGSREFADPNDDAGRSAAIMNRGPEYPLAGCADRPTIPFIEL